MTIEIPCFPTCNILREPHDANGCYSPHAIIIAIRIQLDKSSAFQSTKFHGLQGIIAKGCLIIASQFEDSTLEPTQIYSFRDFGLILCQREAWGHFVSFENDDSIKKWEVASKDDGLMMNKNGDKERLSRQRTVEVLKNSNIHAKTLILTIGDACYF